MIESKKKADGDWCFPSFAVPITELGLSVGMLVTLEELTNV